MGTKNNRINMKQIKKSKKSGAPTYRLVDRAAAVRCERCYGVTFQPYQHIETGAILLGAGFCYKCLLRKSLRFFFMPKP